MGGEGERERSSGRREKEIGEGVMGGDERRGEEERKGEKGEERTGEEWRRD